MRVIYIDVFFAYNFLIDAFLLYITGKLLKLKMSLRVVAGSVFGGVYSSFALIDGFAFMGIFPLRLVFLYFMLCLSYNGNYITHLKASGVFLLNSFIFCGILLAFSLMRGGDYILIDNAPVFLSGYSLLFACMLICVFFCGVFLKFLIKRFALRDMYKVVEAEFNGRRVSLNALVDTGHNLFDYKNMCHVMLVNRENVDLSEKKVHTIEISTVNGCRGLLCLEPQNVEIDKKNYRVTVGIADEKIAGYDALLSANMFVPEGEYV